MQEHLEENEEQGGGTLSDQLYNELVRLNNERFAFEQNSKFYEAGHTKLRLKELGDEYVRQRLLDIRAKHQEQKEHFDQQYTESLQSTQREYDELVEGKEQAIQEGLIALQEAHKAKLQEEQERLRTTAFSAKPTPEILNISHQIKMLVSGQRYNEAAVLQKRLETLRAKALEKIEMKSEEKIRNILEKMMREQAIEMSAAEMKFNREREALIIQREKALEAVHAKFKVVHDKLAQGQQLEALAEEKALKNFNPSSNAFVVISEQESS